MATVYWYDEVDSQWTRTCEREWTASYVSNEPWIREADHNGWDAPSN